MKKISFAVDGETYSADVATRPKTPRDQLEVELQREDPWRDHAFVVLLNMGISILRLPVRRVAHTFGVNRPTVQNWMVGHRLPDLATRKKVFAWLLEQVRTMVPKAAPEPIPRLAPAAAPLLELVRDTPAPLPLHALLDD